MKQYKRTEYRIRLNDVTNAGLLAINLIILQSFIGSRITDTASFISVLCFSISLPLLVCRVLMNLKQNFLGYYLRLLTTRILWYNASGTTFIGTDAAL
jgi:hypothetical protein